MIDDEPKPKPFKRINEIFLDGKQLTGVDLISVTYALPVEVVLGFEMLPEEDDISGDVMMKSFLTQEGSEMTTEVWREYFDGCVLLRTVSPKGSFLNGLYKREIVFKGYCKDYRLFLVNEDGGIDANKPWRIGEPVPGVKMV